MPIFISFIVGHGRSVKERRCPRDNVFIFNSFIEIVLWNRSPDILEKWALINWVDIYMIYIYVTEDIFYKKISGNYQQFLSWLPILQPENQKLCSEMALLKQGF